LIVIDSSALIAVLRREVEADRFLQVIASTIGCVVSSVSLLETSLVLAGRDGDATAWSDLDALITRAGIDVVAQDQEQAIAAREAFLRFGKGRSPARLNLGDCATYALAKVRGARILCKGDDFTRTDAALVTSEAASPET
jgi:ribonuclease VapC